jgi:hypothetical protein
MKASTIGGLAISMCTIFIGGGSDSDKSCIVIRLKTIVVLTRSLCSLLVTREVELDVMRHLIICLRLAVGALSPTRVCSP